GAICSLRTLITLQLVLCTSADVPAAFAAVVDIVPVVFSNPSPTPAGIRWGEFDGNLFSSRLRIRLALSRCAHSAMHRRAWCRLALCRRLSSNSRRSRIICKCSRRRFGRRRGSTALGATLVGWTLWQVGALALKGYSLECWVYFHPHCRRRHQSQSPPSPGNVLAGLSTPVATSAMPVSLRFMSEMRNTIPSVLQPLLCIFATRRLRPSSSLLTRGWRPASMHISCRSLISTQSSQSSRSRISLAAATSSSWRACPSYKSKVCFSFFHRLPLLIVLQLFPGLIYRMIKPKVVLLIFVSGKVVLTGAKVNTFLFLSFSLARSLCDDLVQWPGS
ncbi:hypothetical protein BDZ89DRAFT_1219795, partial [Hymenopellis radicata]